MSEAGRKVLHGSSAIATAQLLANLSAFLLPWAIARGMGDSNYGLYATAYALAVSLASIADTGVRMTLIREISRTPDSWKQLVKYALFISLILACLVGLAFLIFSEIQDESGQATELRAWLLSYALLWTGMRISLGVAVGHKKLVASAIWGSLERLGGAILVILTVFSGHGDLIFIAQELFIWEIFVLGALWWWFFQQSWQSTQESASSLLAFAKVAVPFGITAVVSGLLSRLDLVILGFHQSPENVAMYAAGQALSLVFVFLGVALASTLFPMLSSLGKEKDVVAARRLIEPSVSLLALIMSVGGVALAAGAPIWIQWIYGDAFSEASQWLSLYAMMSPIYAIGAIVGTVIAAWGRQAQFARWSVAALLVSCPGYWIASQWFGMEGVALCVIIVQLALTGRAWLWMVEDGLVGDGWWIGKLALLQLVVAIAIMISSNDLDWMFVLITPIGAIALGVCRFHWLIKFRRFLFVRD